MNKEKVITTIVILATLILAGIAVFTALKLYKRGSQPVSPAAPASRPSAEEEAKACEALIFSLAQEASPTPSQEPGQPTNTPTPSSTSTPTPSPTGTALPTNTPTATPTQGIGGQSDPTPTNTPSPTATSTPTNTPTATPTQGNISSNNPTATPTQAVGGESQPTPTDTRIAQANSPTPTTSGGVGGTTGELMPAGNTMPTWILGLGSIIFIFFGLILAL